MDIYESLQDRVVRIESMRDNFPLFFAYHFGREFMDFHIDRMHSLQGDINTFIEWFRASRKTTIVKWYIIWCIVYKKYSYIVWQSYEDTASTGNVTDIAKMLFVKSIVIDYWQLFPLNSSIEDFSKKTQWNFDTTNKIRVQSRSLKQTARWLNEFDILEWQTERPDLLILDDVDVNDSVMNPAIINKNYNKITGELFGAMDPLHNKKVVLGNTILEDGVVPRLRSLYENSSNWDVFHQPLIKGWINLWPEVFTDEIIEKLQEDWKIAFQQNYLLIPTSWGTGVFVRDYFDYFLTSHFEMVDSPLKKHDIRRWIFVDPAFSTSTKSDDAVVILLGEHKISKQYFLIDWYGGTSAPSSTRSKLLAMYHRNEMSGIKIDFVHCEDAPINKDQTEFVKALREELIENKIECPFYTTIPAQRKSIRITDTLEPVFSMRGVKFNRNLDHKFLIKLESQLLDHPLAEHDDHSDCLAQGVAFFRKRPEKKEQKQISEVRSAVTGKPLNQAFVPSHRVRRPQQSHHSSIRGTAL